MIARSPVARAVSTGAALACAALTCAPSAQAFERSRGPGGYPVAWAGREIAFHLNRRGSADVDFAAVEAATRASFEAWNEPTCSDLFLRYAGTTDREDVGYLVTGTNLNLVVWRESDWPHARGTIGLTTVTFCTQRGGPCSFVGRILDADVEMNGAEFRFDTQGRRLLFDIANTMTHEAGHFIGLDHSPDRNATMFASAPPGETIKRSLHPDDVGGLCHIYPAGAPTPEQEEGAEVRDDEGGCDCRATPGPRGGAGLLALGLGLGLTRRRRSPPPGSQQVR